MRKSAIGFALFVSVALLAAACSGQEQLPAQSTAAAAKLEPSSSESNTVRYVKPGVDLKKYTRFMIEPAGIYSGTDASFGSVSPADQKQIADFMRPEFARVLGRRYHIVTAPGPHVMRIQLMLAGIELTQPALATVTRVLPAALVVNAANTAADQQGTFMGSVTFAVDFYDSQTDDHIAAVVTKQYPSALDVSAAFSGLDAAKAGVTEGAEKLLAAINKIQAGTAPAKK